MKPGISPVPADANEEITAAIEALHRAGQRLEELTGGEVDAVADREGRTFLLRSAQEQLRHSEAVRQAAILNALPAHIALLDSHGLILSVNEAWRQFGKANAIQSPGYGVGVNYLEICDSARGDGSAEAVQVAAGIRAVLSGELKNFSLEYPCHTSTQQRWFLLIVTPLADESPNGVVVMHINITGHKQTEETLHESELRFRQMAENIHDVFFLQSPDSSQIYYVNPAYERIWGRSCESLYANPASWNDAIHPDDLNFSLTQFNEGRNTGFDYEFRILRPDGKMRWMHVRGFPIPDAAGNPYRIAGIASDITQRKLAEIKIKRLNRVYAVLSGINTLIVRVRDRDELFAEACRIAVEEGGFPMTWIGIVDQSAVKIVPLAWAGGNQKLRSAIKDRFALSAQGALEGNTMAARALREKRAIVSNDSQSDANIVFGKEHDESGIRSIAMLPLIVADVAVGVLALYAEEPGFFDAAEMKYLQELAGDISFALDHIEKQERLDYLVYYDVLTGLANRSLFLERVAQYMRSAVSGGHKLALCLIDLERFKNINDSLGRPAGDALLRQVAEWLTRNMGDANLLARVDADHFAVVLPQVRQQDEVVQQLENMLTAFLEHPFRLNDAVFRIAAKAGIALFPDDGADAGTLFKNAEAALKKAKTSGDRYLFYTQKMTATVAGKLTLENQLRMALDQGEFILYYQPQVNLASGKLTGAEALIRWNHPRTGLMPPGRFIPVLEETGLIHEVGRWALHQAVEDYLRWCSADLMAVRVAVNVSPLQLHNRDFIVEIEKAIGVDVRAAAGLELEITESLIMEDVKRSIVSLREIRAMGVSIAIDDFGTGFSSLSYLSKLPVDSLKIDRSFVRDMTTAPEGLALVSTIINLAHALKLNVVAEGVETEEQARLLRLLSCDEMQGYLFSKPVPREIFETRYLVPPPAA